MTIGEKIKELRKSVGWSQPKLAKHLGVTFSAVSNWETGGKSPGYKICIEMELIFGLDPYTLLNMK